MFLTFSCFTDYIPIHFQLAACWSLCYVVQDTNFSEQDFAELLPACWTLCFKLIDDVQEFESKVLFLLIMLFHFLSCYSVVSPEIIFCQHWIGVQFRLIHLVWQLSFWVGSFPCLILWDLSSLHFQVLVLNFISVLLEAVGEKVIPFASQLSKYFQKVCI